MIFLSFTLIFSMELKKKKIKILLLNINLYCIKLNLFTKILKHGHSKVPLNN